MNRRFLAFDIETAAVLSEPQFQDWRRHRPLGITCIASQASDAAAPTFWDAREAVGNTSGRMTPAQLVDFIAYLQRMSTQGYTLLTWNGLGFYWDVLAEEAGFFETCRELATNHVDMMFHIFCDRGYPVALDKAAQGHGIPGKPPGMAGFLAPQKWAQGCYQEVLEYVGQDVRITLEVAKRSEEQRSFRWITSRGKTSSMPLHSGWLNVRSAIQLPEPDTSWMSDPIPRARFLEWLGNARDR
jgi:hypothetical protein